MNESCNGYNGAKRRIIPTLLTALCICVTTKDALAVNGRIAFSTNRDGNYEIYSMLPNGGSPTNLTNDAADDSTPAWNFDSTRIAFASTRPFSDRELYTMPAAGSATPTRYSNHNGDDAYPIWNPSQNRILFTSSLSGQPDIWMVDATGESPSLLTNFTGRDGIDSFAAWSPDGGKIVFASQRDQNTGSGVTNFNLWVMDYNKTSSSVSSPIQLTTEAGDDIHPRWSKDGTKIYFASQRIGNTGTVGDFNIWVAPFDKATNTLGTPIQLTFDPADDVWPAPAPDGDKVAFQSNRSGNEDIWVMDPDGASPLNLTASSTASDVEPSWSQARETPSLVVDISGDIVDPFDGKTSLREALSFAASNPGADTVTFAPALTNQNIPLSTIGDTTLGNSAFLIDSDVTISAPGQKLTLQADSAPNSMRAFYVNAAGSLTLRGLTLRGFTQLGNNGNNFSPTNNEADLVGKDGLGGTIYNAGGTVRMENCLVRDSTAQGGAGGATSYIDFDAGGTVVYLRGTGGKGRGGVIFNTGSLTIVQCTMTNSIAVGGLGGIINGSRGPTGLAHGGAIANEGSAALFFATIAANRASGNNQAASAVWSSGSVNLQSSILAGSLNGTTDAENEGGTWTSAFSIIQSKGSGVPAAGVSEVDPQLAPLANNGGATFTMAIGTGSPAINAGDPAFNPNSFTPPLTTDQRGTGFNRVVGGRVDIGAYESQSAGLPTLTINDVSVNETNGGSAQAQLTITLSAASLQTVTVVAQTASNAGSPAATAGADYNALPATTITFNPGQTTRTVNVTVLGDTLDENDEKFAINLSSPANAVIGDASGTITIIDNDAPPSISSSAVNVTEGSSGTKTLTFTLSLSTASARNISVQYQSANAATFPATSGVDYVAVPLTTVIFNAGQTTKTVNVTVNADTLDEENEHIALNLTNPVNATLGTQSDGIIIDDDATPGLSINDQSVLEGNSGTKLMTFTVTLSAASGRTVTVNVATGNGGSPAATAGSDYVALPTTLLTFTPGQTSKQVSVTLNGDTTVEVDEKLGIILSGAVNATLADNSGIGTILNDDAAGLTAPSTASASAKVNAPSSSVKLAFADNQAAASSKRFTHVSTTALNGKVAKPRGIQRNCSLMARRLHNGTVDG